MDTCTRIRACTHTSSLYTHMNIMRSNRIRTYISWTISIYICYPVERINFMLLSHSAADHSYWWIQIFLFFMAWWMNLAVHVITWVSSFCNRKIFFSLLSRVINCEYLFEFGTGRQCARLWTYCILIENEARLPTHDTHYTVVVLLVWSGLCDDPFRFPKCGNWSWI